MKRVRLLILLAILLCPLHAFSQNSIRITAGNLTVQYFLSGNAYPTFQMAGENNFVLGSTNIPGNSFVLETFRFPVTRTVVDTVLPPVEQRGNINVGSGGYGNIQFAHPAAAEKTNFVFDLEYQVRKFTPKEQIIGVDAPFTMQGRVLAYAVGVEFPTQLYSTEVHGSGIAHLTFIRLNGFAGRQQKKVYLQKVVYEFTAN